jgi:aspartate aminotransferase
MSLVAKKLSKIKPSPTLSITAKAIQLKASGLDVISLSIGEPDFDTPNNVKAAAIRAIEAGFTKYTEVDGTKELKQAICDKLSRENNIGYEVNQISVGTGAKQVIYNALMASIDPGDEVIIPAPYWVSYPDMVSLAEGSPVFVNCGPETNFKITPLQLDKTITKKTKWVILNSPSNPTGSAYTEDELKKLSEVLLAHPNVYVLSDDIYEHLLYDGKEFATIAAVEPRLKERVLTVNGVSKSHAMTGWRIGYGAGPVELIKAMGIIQSQSTTNPSSISQKAAVEALNGDQTFLHEQKAVFAKRRDMVVQMLNEVEGISATTPDGAFYVFADCRKLFGKTTPLGKKLQNSSDVVEFLLEDALVATVHGSAFGTEGFFRISYATSETLLIEACKRIKESCAKLT